MGKLIVGLGNPGPKYKNNRHNTGFMAVDFLQKHYEFDDFKEEKKFNALLATGEINMDKILLAKPQTFMNNSGESVQKIMAYFKIEPKDITIIYDDIDLPIGSTRIKNKGSAGTHNGMKSIIQHVGTEEFQRIRIGIESRGETMQDITSFVLNDFSRQERQIIQKEFKKLLDFFTSHN